MKKGYCILLVLCLLLCFGIASAETADIQAVREDNLSVTHHTTTIQGKEIAYTASAGTMAMSTDLGDYDMFYIAYTLDDVEDPATRPITFAYNGGPGAGSAFVHLGLFGPEHLNLDENGMVMQVPGLYRENEYSLLDLTDLVFIDPVGTGYSRAAEGTDQQTFFDYDTDIQSIGDFIHQYLNRNKRWASPKYLAGESYGTVRTAGICDYLLNQLSIDLNGIMMISSVNDFSTIEFDNGNDGPYASYLPSYAAIAWYHGRAAEEYQNMALTDFLDEVRDFTAGEFWSALYKGSRMSSEETEAIAEKMSRYIGLDKDLILKKNLRIDSDTFCMELLADEKLFVGRTDGRYTGPATSGSIGEGTADPSVAGVMQNFTDAMRDLVTRELEYQTDETYNILNSVVGESWTYMNYQNRDLRQEEIIHDSMSRNKYMKVWVICGYYDLATPFYNAEWVYSHLFLNDEYKDNLQFTYYESGHMFYTHEPSLQQFRKEAEAWYRAD